MPKISDPKVALARLVEGNARFAAGSGRGTTFVQLGGESQPQSPFAIVLGCSDSRVPAEIVFDQGIGDLFVIRIAGNIVAPSQIGSIEFAATRFGTTLVVVLGHTECGAVAATLDAIAHPETETSPGIASIVDRIRPALEPLSKGPEDVSAIAVQANVRASCEQLVEGSEILAGLVEEGSLLIVGAEYDLSTGEVRFLD